MSATFYLPAVHRKIPGHKALVAKILQPLYTRTPDQVRLFAAFLDADQRLISLQTIALCPPPAKRIDNRRLLSLATWPSGAAGVILAHNQPGSEVPANFNEELVKSVRHISKLADRRKVPLVDYLVMGQGAYWTATGNNDLKYFCRGWQ